MMNTNRVVRQLAPVLVMVLVMLAALWPQAVVSQSNCPPLTRSGPLIVGAPRVTPGVGSATAGDLIVPGGVTCSLESSEHFGNIAVESGGTLKLVNVTVAGEVRGESPQSTSLEGSRLLGGFQVAGGGPVMLRTTDVAGSVLIEGASGGVTVNKSVIGGALLVNHSGDTVEITENTVGGEMRCEGNYGTLRVEGNSVTGDMDPACQGG